ncbi:helix-turn-helix transcriptional regulator [Actinomadura sp. NPDC047616]|uniref:helix-turn-helix domain-containing protein n=1 Tax=Actinomadura sp. NPDC047616 TaxID=3155914 RepID=UPI0033EABCC7
MGDDLTLGERIAFHRRRRGLSQKEFASEIGRSESWVSQVERGARSVDRLSVLQHLADVLGIPLAELRAEAGPQERRSDVQELRLTLTGHPALASVLGEQPATEAIDVSQLEATAEPVWPLLHQSRYDELEPLLARLIPALEQATRQAGNETSTRAYELLAKTYQAAASMLARLGESDAAWIAADRAVRTAEQTSEPLSVVAGLFRMAHAFLGLRQLQEAHHVAHGAASVLRPRAQEEDAPRELLSLYGAMNLVLAVIAARDSDRQSARQYLREARRTAERIGEDRNDFGTEFGPTNVAIHAISVAVDLGDAGEAVELAGDLDASALSPERQFRLHLDVARAETQRRHIGDAIHRLAQADEIAPEHFQAHPLPRETVRDLVQLAGRRIPDELREMARRLGVLP